MSFRLIVSLPDPVVTPVAVAVSVNVITLSPSPAFTVNATALSFRIRVSLPVLVVITACAEVPALVMFAKMSPVAISALMTVTSAIPKLTSADPLTMTASAVVVVIATSLPSADIVTVEPVRSVTVASADERVSVTSPPMDDTEVAVNEAASTSTFPEPASTVSGRDISTCRDR